MVATNGSATYVMFLYRDIQWDSNRTSIGFNAGDGIRGFNLNNSFDDTFNLTVDLQRESNVAPEFPGVFMFRVDQEMVIQASGKVCYYCLHLYCIFRPLNSHDLVV